MRARRKELKCVELALSSSGEREPIEVLVMVPTVALASQKTSNGKLGLRLLQSLSKVFHQMVLALSDIFTLEAREVLASH